VWHNLCEAALSEIKAHSNCWATVLETPLCDGPRARTTLERWHQIHDLLDQGVGLLECGRRLQLSLNTVKRYARADRPERMLRVPKFRTSLVDPYREHLRKRRATPQGFPVGEEDSQGNPLFNRSHIIGDRFHGANIPENIFTGYRRFKLSGIKTCENRMAEALATEPVTYGAVLEYGDPNVDRPTAITMTASTPTRKLFSLRIDNKNANGGGC
jgi:hypothetical protein